MSNKICFYFIRFGDGNTLLSLTVNVVNKYDK